MDSRLRPRHSLSPLPKDLLHRPAAEILKEEEGTGKNDYGTDFREDNRDHPSWLPPPDTPGKLAAYQKRLEGTPSSIQELQKSMPETRFLYADTLPGHPSCLEKNVVGKYYTMSEKDRAFAAHFFWDSFPTVNRIADKVFRGTR